MGPLGCGDESDAGDNAGTGGSAGAGGNGPNVPPEPLRAEYLLSSEDSIPEGVTFDPVERAFYVGSFNGGSITRILADGTEEVIRTADGGSLTGMKVDEERRRLWVCASPELWVFDLDDDTRSHVFPLSAAAEGAGCNDVTVDGEGRAYATDSTRPNIYTASVDTTDASVFAADPSFEATVLGLNGIEVSEDGSMLFVVKFLEGKLFTVSLTTPTDITEVALSGDDFSMPDGVVVLEGHVYAISDSNLKRVAFDASGYASGTVTTVPYPEGGLSTGTAAEGRLYAVRSETTAFVLNQPIDLPFKIVEFSLGSFP